MSSQEPTGGADAIPEPVLTDLLGSRRRCHLLVQLDAAGGEAVVDDLAASVCAAEEECDPDCIDDETRSAVREELFDRHISKLTAVGVVEYDSMLNAVRLTTAGVASRAASRLADDESQGVGSQDR